MNLLLTRRTVTYKWMTLFACVTETLFLNDLITLIAIFTHCHAHLRHDCAKVATRNAHLFIKIMTERL